MSPDPDILAVLDPAKSAVVEACAGSGKTWLLAARIVRLLLAGAKPGEILAITFTQGSARDRGARRRGAAPPGLADDRMSSATCGTGCRKRRSMLPRLRVPEGSTNC